MILLKTEDLMIDELVSYSWRVYQNPKTRFYPIVDSIDDIYLNIAKSCQNNSLLVLRSDDDLAILPLIIDHENRYIQGVGGIVSEMKTEQFFTEFYRIVSQRFNGYNFSMGYPSSNTSAITSLERLGFQCIENLFRYELDLGMNFASISEVDLCELDQSDNAEFCAFHNLRNPIAYWSGEKIIASRDRWTIHIIKDTGIVGTACAKHYRKNEVEYAEIYFIDRKDSTEELINNLLQSFRRKSVQKVVYLIEDTEVERLSLLEKFGFKRLDDYLGYSIEI